jgi:lipoprotein signal peptidase
LRVVAVVGIVLCLSVFWPGVVDQANLDARPVNAIAGIGVLVALVLSLVCGFHGWSQNARGDGYRDVVGTLAVLLALPWIFAELGFYLDGVPLLDRVFETGVYRTRGAEVAVHHGHHHGLDGLVLLLTAILLSRVVPSIRTRRLRLLLAAYLSLMAAYGLGNMVNDFWTEQIWKRGWTDWQFPSLLQPTLSVGWALMILGAALMLAMSIESPHSRMGRLAQRRR